MFCSYEFQAASEAGVAKDGDRAASDWATFKAPPESHRRRQAALDGRSYRCAQILKVAQKHPMVGQYQYTYFTEWGFGPSHDRDEFPPVDSNFGC